MSKKEIETTFYRFLSEVRSFLSKLVSDPIKADTTKYLKDRNFNKTKLINVLLKKEVLERHEKILDSTNSDEKEAKYVVKYKVKKKDFEKKIHRIYIKYFEKNEPEKLNECDGADASLGGTSAESVGGQYSTVIGGVMSRVMAGSPKEKEKGKNIDPKNILGKNLKAETKTPKRIYITEKQYNLIMANESLTTSGAGDMGDYTANGLILKTSDGKEDPCAKAGKIRVKQIMDK